MTHCATKYREERDKRLRPDGNEQYLQPTGRFAHLLDDPYTPRVEREPLFDEVTVAVIGGGFSGLTTGARLKQAGIDDVRIIEGGGDVGGAWYWNRYPGAMCDTAAMVYLPLLEETGHMPSMKYVYAPGDLRSREAHRHHTSASTTTRCSPRRSPSSSGTTTPRAGSSTPTAATRIRAKFVAMGTGPLHRPEAAGHPRHRDLRRARASTPVGGTTPTPAATRPARR